MPAAARSSSGTSARPRCSRATSSRSTHPAAAGSERPDLDLVEHYRFCAKYNRWFNERLYAACDSLGEAERRRARGAFFGSIHGTLNHIVWGDRLWLARFAAQGERFPMLSGALLAVPEGARHASILHDDWQELREARSAIDAAIEDWTAAMTPAFVSSTMRYANTAGVGREHAMWKALSHFFNHQTHHRGQVTTLLAQAGVDVGVTDMIALA